MFRALFAGGALCFLATAGCASNVDDEADVVAESGDLTKRTPLAVASLEGQNWLVTSSVARAHDGDILALRLYPDGSYVRLRCYGAACAKVIPESDRFTAFQSKGKRYLQFSSFVRVLVPPRPAAPGAPGAPAKPASAPEYEDHSVVADTYELLVVGGEIALRKTSTARWTTLGAVDDPTLCDASGGTWSPATPPPAQIAKVPPTTKGQGPAQPPAAGTPAVPVPTSEPGTACRCPPGTSFVGGAGGCIQTPSTTEAACDASNGSYTDDDATKLGTFCACGLGRTLADTGCVAF